MSTYVGDIVVGATVRGMFNTRTTAGVPIGMTDSPTLIVYKNGSLPGDTAGASLSADHDFDGQHQWTINTAADGTFYTAGSDYYVVLASGEVDSIIVYGVVVGHFSIENRSLAPVTTKVNAILALLDDARTEPGQAAPPVSADLATKVDYLYKFLRNKTTQTATTLSVFGDDGTTVDHKATTSDDTTTFTRSEFVGGP